MSTRSMALLFLTAWMTAPALGRARHPLVPLMPEKLPDDMELRELDAGPARQPVLRREYRPLARPARHSPRELYFASAARRVSDENEAVPVAVEAAPEPDAAPRPPKGYGFELGSVMTPVNVSGDMLGLEMLWGGRLFARFPLSRKLFLKPTAGYFYRSKSEASASVSQSLIEAGVTALYTPWPAHKTVVLFGVTQKVDTLFSSISVMGSSATTPVGFRYRIGPAIELSSSISRHLNFVTDLELTFTATSPLHTYGGLTLGLMFK